MSKSKIVVTKVTERLGRRTTGQRPLHGGMEPVRVLMCGPQVDLPGGMSTVGRVLAATANASGRYQVRVVDSGGGGERGVRGYLNYIPALLVAATAHYDVMHVHVAEKGSTLRKGILAEVARQRGIPYVVHLHAAEYGPFLESCQPRTKELVARFYRQAGGVIVLGTDWLDLLVRELGLAPESLTIVHNGVESIGGVPDAEKASDRYLVFVGEVSKRKGADLLLDVAEDLQRDEGMPGWKIVLLGTLFDSVIERRAKDLAPTVRALGSKSGSEKDELIRNASVFVLPSRAEALPMAILEAMSAGLPCLVTDVGSISQVVENGVNGVVIAPDDAEQLKQAMITLTHDADLRERLGSAAQDTWREGYSAEAMTEGIARLWDACLPISK